MMIDPLAAIGLAGNIIQFVDFSYLLVCESKALYASGTGATAENVVIETITTDLDLLNNRLTAPSAPGQIPDPIRKLASLCKGVAEDLLDVLEDIKVKGSHKRYKSFVQALRSVWKKAKIEALVRRMENLRSEMQFRLQVMMSEQQSEIRVVLDRLIEENRRLNVDRATQIQTLIEDVLLAVLQLKPEAALVGSTVQDMSTAIQKLDPVDPELIKRLSDNMKDLSSKFSTLASGMRSIAIEQALLSSLWFKQISERSQSVAPAHEKTFEWIFDTTSPAKFNDWIRSQNGIYWITGKPGSGKSTLMKYLLYDKRTTMALKSWAGNERLVLAKFFFWHAGNEMQKSQIGLFQSLLFEILRQCPDLIQTVCTSKTETFRPFAAELEPWTLPELRQAIKALKNQSSVTACFCFFIDGLDEYAGDPSDIVEDVENLRSWPNIKLCISSRPWNEFVQAFGRPSDPQLAVEDLTRDDIRIYVRDKLEENSRFKEMRARDDRSQELVLEIVDKARGIFLWVYLVVRLLLKGLGNADRIIDLQKKLRSFPDTLERFFRHMLDSVDNDYQEQTAQTIKIALESGEPLSLMTYSFLDEENLDNLIRTPFRPLTTSEVLSRQEDMRIRLSARCKGLLEVAEYRAATGDIIHDGFCAIKVDFLHRTAYDFLVNTEDVREMIAKNLKPDFNPKTRICMAFLAQAQALNSNHHSKYHGTILRDLIEQFLVFARSLEEETGVPQVSLLDELGSIASKRVWNKKKFSFMHFVIGQCLFLYVDAVLERNPQMLEYQYRPLLASALGWPGRMKDLDSRHARMIEILLRHGASPNENLVDSSVWDYFIQTVKIVQNDADNGPTKAIIALLLSHGADPDTKVVVKQASIPGTRRITGRAADLHRKSGPSHVTYFKSAREVIMETYGAEVGEELLSNAQKPQMPQVQTQHAQMPQMPQHQTQQSSILSRLWSSLSWH